jgi:prevent-host-death family protein
VKSLRSRAIMTLVTMRAPTTVAPAEVKAGEFKAKCLELMDSVARTGATIVITKRVKPIARLVPVVDPSVSIFGFAKAAFEELGDIVAPVAPEWRPNESELTLLNRREETESRTRAKRTKRSAR